MLVQVYEMFLGKPLLQMWLIDLLKAMPFINSNQKSKDGEHCLAVSPQVYITHLLFFAHIIL